MSLQSRASTYSQADTVASSRDERLARLKRELRDHVRLLTNTKVLNNEWLRMADSLHQIANVAVVEESLLNPDPQNPLDQHGKKDKGTLWDQERDQIAIRIILEEGKLNLILRIMHNYRETLRSGIFSNLVTECSGRYRSDATAIRDRCLVFEQSLGFLINLSFDHTEALQIVDWSEFITHIKEVLQDGQEESKRKPNLLKLQEALVIQYLDKLTCSFDHVDEERILAILRQNHIILNLTEELKSHYLWYNVTTLISATKFFSNVFGTEDYLTEPHKYVQNILLKKDILSMKGKFVNELIAKHNLPKRDIRPLLDQFLKWEKEFGKSEDIPLKFAVEEQEHGDEAQS